jgi:hypothetical protein
LAKSELVGEQAVDQSGLASFSRSGDHHSHAEDFGWCVIGSLELSEVGEDLSIRFLRELGWQRESLEVLVEINAPERERERQRER